LKLKKIKENEDASKGGIVVGVNDLEAPPHNNEIIMRVMSDNIKDNIEEN